MNAPRIPADNDLRNTLLELAERTANPDCDLDSDIFLVVRPSARGRIFNAPRYTTSLDAAMALVPEGWRPRLDFDARRRCYLHPETGLCIGVNPHGWQHYADAETMPLAICAAALRARAAMA